MKQDRRLENMIKNMESIASKDINKIIKYTSNIIDYAVSHDNHNIIGRLSDLGIEIPEHAKDLYNRALAEKNHKY